MKWVIRLPDNAKVLVSVGDSVLKGQKVAEMDDIEIKSFNYSLIFKNFGQEKILSLNDSFKGNWVDEGSIFCITDGFLKKRICFPISGDFLEIDELGTLKIAIKQDKKREIFSPVKSKVSKIEDGKIVLDFWAKEFKGQGLVEAKSWAEGRIDVINKAEQLDSELDGGILFTNNLDRCFLLKAEVVGVSGVVTNQKDEEVEANLPVLYLEDNLWEELISNFDDKEYQFLINSRSGRLLLVLE